MRWIASLTPCKGLSGVCLPIQMLFTIILRDIPRVVLLRRNPSQGSKNGHSGAIERFARTTLAIDGRTGSAHKSTGRSSAGTDAQLTNGHSFRVQ
jgi:hypothetical protein